MSIEHREPSTATVKELYANAYRCASPGCQRPLYKVDSETGVRTRNSTVAHICARREGGPRWNAHQSEAENRSVGNLIVACLEHSSEIDDPARASQFSVEVLREWKKRQLEEFDALGQGWALSDEEANAAAKASFQLHLGGEGGRALGAGGGGGGAVGEGARGGDGGPGGNIFFVGRDASAPGAGGGGAGAAGKGSVGGQGGGGGDLTVGVFRVEDLPDSVEIIVGRGGKGGCCDGDGADGEDSAFGDFLRAKGGKGGKAGISEAVASPASFAQGKLQVPIALFADDAEISDGAINVTRACWNHFNVRELPATVSGKFVFVVDSTVEGSAQLGIELLEPGGTAACHKSIEVELRGSHRTKRSVNIVPFTAAVSASGTWAMRILSGQDELVRVLFSVELA